MNIIRKTLLIIAIIILQISVAWSQIIISGQLRDNNTYMGVPNHLLQITAAPNNLNFSYSKAKTTNVQGAFMDTIIIPNNSIIKFYITTLDCNNNIIIDSIYSNYLYPKTIDICTNGLNLCLADWVAYPDTANYKFIHFFNLSSNNVDSYVWSFGDTTFSASENPDHSYTNSGSFFVCLVVFDSTTLCTNVNCKNIIIAPNMNCRNSFISTKIAPKEFQFSANLNIAYPSLYEWDFGDFTTGNGKNIQHQYNQPGTYTVTLKSTSMHPQTHDTCISFSSHNVTATGPPTAGLFGQVFADANMITNAIVYLYSYDKQNNLFSLKDSTLVQHDSISFYQFIGLPYGNYTTKLKLLPNSNYLTSYAPAYAGNTFRWDKAKILNLSNVSNLLPINLTHLYSTNGNSSISGAVIQGSKASPGDSVPNIPIYLLNQDMVPVDFVYSDDKGSFIFKNLIEQKYYLYTDIINYSVSPSTTTIKSSNSKRNGINIYLGSGTITGINHASPIKLLNVFPNPANDILNLEFVSTKYQKTEIELINLLGQVQKRKAIRTENIATKNKIHFNISDIPSGVYFIRISSDNAIESNHKIIISH